MLSWVESVIVCCPFVQVFFPSILVVHSVSIILKREKANDEDQMDDVTLEILVYGYFWAVTSCSSMSIWVMNNGVIVSSVKSIE